VVTISSAKEAEDEKDKRQTALLMTAFRAPRSVPVLGITGGVLGGLIGTLFCILSLVITQEYYAGYYPGSSVTFILVTFLASFGILAFSVIGALGAVQKLDSRLTVNAGGLFLSGGAVLVFMLYLMISQATGQDTATVIFSLAFIFIGLVVSILFFLCGYTLLRKPAGLP